MYESLVKIQVEHFLSGAAFTLKPISFPSF